jgi:hypothetical protein
MISVFDLKDEIARLDDLIEAQKAAVANQEGLLRELQQIRKLKMDLLERISKKEAVAKNKGDIHPSEHSQNLDRPGRT